MTIARETVRSAPGENWYILLLALGLVAVYLPSYLAAANKFWTDDEDAFGPIVVMIIVWLCWRERRVLQVTPSGAERMAGIGFFVSGLGTYVIGRSQEFFQFDIGSQALVLMGLALSLGGTAALRRYWFPACFALLLVPVPPSLVDHVLVPLKVTVSQVVTEGLYMLGFPISRAGVVLVIGQYPLLIANACSGLRSMVALSSIGLLFVYVLGYGSGILNGIFLSAAIPIAFLANVTRVTALVLITYYFGAEAGSRFHDIAGYFEIALAFGAFFALDAILSRFLKRRQRAPANERPSPLGPRAAAIRRGIFVAATVALFCAAGAAVALAPRLVIEKRPDSLDVLIPRHLDSWQAAAPNTQQVSLFAVDENGENPMQRVYDDSLLRTYVRADGRQIMVAIAYDHVQREEDRVHRPEICYVAQGFSILADQPITFRLDQSNRRDIEGRQMLTRNGERLEAVSYWIRTGTSFSQNPWQSRFYIIREGLAGRLHDGVLVRVSEIIGNANEATESFAVQGEFLDGLIASVSPQAAQVLAGTANMAARAP